MVMRTVVGAGFRAAAEHSQTLYSLFAHIPGLKVVAPYSAADAKGLMIAAILDDDPVVFLEHKRLYMETDAVDEAMTPIPLGKGVVRRSGSDVTIVAIQRMNLFALQAADVLAEQGIEAEIIDPRTYSPLDEDLILQSVAKTGRLAIVDESYPRCSLAADISALAAERAFSSLKAPIARVTAPHTPVPFSPPMEDYFIPSVDRIVRRVRETIDF
jgi:pyruvate dehydrogenase E1 component beta subunit